MKSAEEGLVVKTQGKQECGMFKDS